MCGLKKITIFFIIFTLMGINSTFVNADKLTSMPSCVQDPKNELVNNQSIRIGFKIICDKVLTGTWGYLTGGIVKYDLHQLAHKLEGEKDKKNPILDIETTYNIKELKQLDDQNGYAVIEYQVFLINKNIKDKVSTKFMKLTLKNNGKIWEIIDLPSPYELIRESMMEKQGTIMVNNKQQKRDVDTRNINSLVAAFCMDEGMVNELYKYTPQAVKRFKEIYKDDLVHYESLREDPISVVDSYKIEEIKQVDENHAYAIISYHQLATRGKNSLKDIRNIREKLLLEHDGIRWWIIDPPISKAFYDLVLEAHYNETRSIYLSYIKKNLAATNKSPEETERLKEVYKHEKEILLFLLSLKSESNSKYDPQTFEDLQAEKNILITQSKSI